MSDEAVVAVGLISLVGGLILLVDWLLLYLWEEEDEKPYRVNKRW